MNEKFEIGDHIIYIPPHANGDENHQDCEIGFITNVNDTVAFCKFFYPDGRLRTKANSEACWVIYIKKISNVKMYLEQERL